MIWYNTWTVYIASCKCIGSIINTWLQHLSSGDYLNSGFPQDEKMEVNVSWLQFWAKMQHVAKFMTRTTTYFSLERKFRCLWIKCTKTKSNSSIFCFDKIIVHEPFGLQSPYMPQISDRNWVSPRWLCYNHKQNQYPCFGF